MRPDQSATPADELDWGPVLAFLPTLESPDFEAGEWRGGEELEDGSIQMPYTVLSDEAHDLTTALYDQGVIVAFEWSSWMASDGVRFVESDEALRLATLEDCRRLLTAHVRSDRFVEGHLLAALESGHIQAILRRVWVLTRPKESPTSGAEADEGDAGL